MSGFKPATKQLAKLRLALCGPSGSGKTYSALRVALGLGGKVAVIDTERGSASLYADRFAFDVLEIEPPYKPSKYVEAIQQAEAAGYDVLVIDSLSHAWAGEGGVLETVDETASKTGNKFTAWAPGTKAQNALINGVLNAKLHIIATMRSKQEYALEANHQGKMTPKKLGMAPVQRDGVEYEFAVVLDVGMSHEAGVGMSGKDRTGLFEGQPPKQLTEEDGKRIMAWLTGAAPPSQAQPSKTSPPQSVQHEADSLQAAADEWRQKINGLADPTDFDAAAKEINGIGDKALQKEVASWLRSRAGKIGLVWDKASKRHVSAREVA